MASEVKCPDCKGSGKLNFYSGVAHCRKCDGSGRISQERAEHLKRMQLAQDRARSEEQASNRGDS